MNGNEIAIIGMAGRFPGAKDVDRFWANLSAGVESIRFFTEEELASANIDPAVFRDPLYIKAASALDDADYLDANFFNISHREAEIMDPQHRVLLEYAWLALENACYDSETYKGAIGVFAGATINTYLLLNVSSNPELISSLDDGQINIGNGGDFLTTRISYKMDLKGPSHVVQCACSTSLVSVHVACQSLLNQECDMALAGGVSVNVKHRYGYRYLPGAMASPDGHCRAFDASAQGTIFGSGVGMVVLKRLEDALKDGDYIHAVIKGSAINNDGSLKVGYTAPSVDGQAQVITEALANAGINAETVTYIEAHGTGTPLGDPIEIEALTKAFRATTDKKGFCAIGSVKTNIGHLDAAAGITGLIKTVLALKHGKLPASLHFKRPNPDIDFLNSPFYVNVKLSDWKANGSPRRAGVSSFGVGGTNAHVIVEEAPRQNESRDTRPQKLLLLSAKTDTALEAATSNLLESLKQNRQTNLADVAHSLQVGRRRFKHRRAVVCSDVNEAVELLTSLDPGRTFTSYEESTERSVVFMFPGQGAQRINMAVGLYQLDPLFRKEVDFCFKLLRPLLGYDLKEIIYPQPEREDEASRLLNQTSITQPALFVVEYALAEMWKRCGIKPEAMIGHSIGEYVAACEAGVMRVEEGLKVVAARGRMMQAMPKGSMLAVVMGEEEVRGVLGKHLSLAAVNGPNQCVVSGPAEPINELESLLEEQGFSCRQLRTSHAFHSAMMESILDEFKNIIGQMNLSEPRIPYISNVTGTWIKPEEAVSPDYWARHLRETVQFHAGVRELLRRPEAILLEVGPGETLTRLARRQPEVMARSNAIASLGPADNSESDFSLMTKSLGKLWVAGTAVDWSQFYNAEHRLRVELPAYPFEKQRYWIEPGQKMTFAQTNPETLEKNADISRWFYLPSWKLSMPPGRLAVGSLAEAERNWLLFVEENELSLRLAERLREEGQKVIIVKQGESFAKDDDNVYRINPDRKSDYISLAKGLNAAGKNVSDIVHLWGLAVDEDMLNAPESFEAAQIRGFYSLVYLAQAISKSNVREAVRVNVISNGVCSLDDRESLRPEKATVLGFCKVIQQEYPDAACRFIDIPAVNSEVHDPKHLVEQLLSEFSGEKNEPVIAYRGSRRWSQVFEPAQLESAGRALGLLRDRGVYLITGGATGIGRVIAEHLAVAARAKLAIVVEQTDFPKRETWGQWLVSHDEGDATSRLIKQFEWLEGLGAEVFIIAADSSDRQEMRTSVLRCLKHFGKLNGVFHVANFASKESFRTILEIDRDAGEALLNSTASRLYDLRDALQNAEPDFCILNSSLSSILGGMGAAIDSSANIFMAAFAGDCNKSGSTIWMSVNWDEWRFEEEMQPLAATDPEPAQLAITPDEGIEALRRILELNAVGQVIVSPADLHTRMKRRPKDLNPLRNSVRDARRAAHPRPQLRSTFAAPGNETEQALADIWQRTFSIDQVGTLDNFFELGGDSLLALQVIAEINRELKTDLPVVSLYEALTIKALAEIANPKNNDDRPDAKDEVVNLEQKAAHKRQYQQARRSRRKEV